MEALVKHVVSGLITGAVFILLIPGCGADRNWSNSSAFSPLAPESTVAKPGVGAMSINFKFTSAAKGKIVGKLAANEAIDRVTGYVYKMNGKELIHQDLAIKGGYASGTIPVPAPDTVKVAVAFYEGAIVRWLGETNYVLIDPGMNTPVTINEEFMGVSGMVYMQIVPINSSYKISWSKSSLATSYELWESTSETQGSGTIVYTGAGDSYMIPGKADEGILYYRARAATQYGFGPWYYLGLAPVQISLQGNPGGVEINTEIPRSEP